MKELFAIRNGLMTKWGRRPEGNFYGCTKARGLETAAPEKAGLAGNRNQNEGVASIKVAEKGRCQEGKVASFTAHGGH